MSGGIPFNKVISYWEKKTSEQKKNAVGFANELVKQDKNYQIRFDFIIPKIDTTLKTLDYGCGIGRYANFFNPDKYIGIDITKELLHIAICDNPEYDFKLQTIPDLSEFTNIDFDQFFSCTVLQHNTDNGVDKILSSLKKLKPKNLTIVLYENTTNAQNIEFVNFRTIKDYKDFIEKYYKIKNWNYYKHIIHGHEHSLIIFKC